MAIAIASVTTVAVDTIISGTLTFTKPSGLAEGDLMVAVLQYRSGSFAAPAGWTYYPDASFLNRYQVFAKQASSGDAAASDFSWTETDVDFGGGCLYRITGASIDDIQSDGGNDMGTAPAPQIDVSLSPIATDSLLIFVANVSGSDNYVEDLSAFAVTGGATPTFTDRSFFRDDGDNINHGLVDGTYSSTDEITQITFNDPNDEVQHAGILLIDAQQTASGSNTLVTATATTFTASGQNSAQGTSTLITTTSAAFSQAGKVSRRTKWTNNSKPSTTYTNTPKL